jgi:hypothetical protein
MKVPVATSRERSASVSVSVAGGGGKTYGKMKKPSTTPKAVPSRPPNTNTPISRKNLRMGQAPVFRDWRHHLPISRAALMVTASMNFDRDM